METNDNILKELDREIREVEQTLEGLRETRRYFSNKKKSQSPHLNGKSVPNVFIAGTIKDKFAPTVRNIILQNDQWFSTNEICEILREKYSDKTNTGKKLIAFKNAISFVLSEAKRKRLGVTRYGNSRKNSKWGKSEWVDSKGNVKPDFVLNLNENN